MNGYTEGVLLRKVTAKQLLSPYIKHRKLHILSFSVMYIWIWLFQLIQCSLLCKLYLFQCMFQQPDWKYLNRNYHQMIDNNSAVQWCATCSDWWNLAEAPARLWGLPFSEHQVGHFQNSVTQSSMLFTYVCLFTPTSWWLDSNETGKIALWNSRLCSSIGVLWLKIWCCKIRQISQLLALVPCHLWEGGHT